MSLSWCSDFVFYYSEFAESTAEKGNKSTEQENQGPKTQSVWIMIFICVFLLLASIVLSVAYFMFKWRNRAQAASEGTVANF